MASVEVFWESEPEHQSELDFLARLRPHQGVIETPAGAGMTTSARINEAKPVLHLALRLSLSFFSGRPWDTET